MKSMARGVRPAAGWAGAHIQETERTMKTEELLENQGTSEAATMTESQPASPKVDESAAARRGGRDEEDGVRGAAAGRRWARERANDMQRKDIEELAHDEEKLFAPELNQPSLFFLFELTVNRDVLATPSLSKAEVLRAWFPPRGTRLSRAYVRSFVKGANEHWQVAQKGVAE